MTQAVHLSKAYVQRSKLCSISHQRVSKDHLNGGREEAPGNRTHLEELHHGRKAAVHDRFHGERRTYRSLAKLDRQPPAPRRGWGPDAAAAAPRPRQRCPECCEFGQGTRQSPPRQRASTPCPTSTSSLRPPAPASVSAPVTSRGLLDIVVLVLNRSWTSKFY
jgi:hypothetical protein